MLELLPLPFLSVTRRFDSLGIEVMKIDGRIGLSTDKPGGGRD